MWGDNLTMKFPPDFYNNTALNGLINSLLHQIKWFQAANLTDLQKGKETRTCEKWLLRGVLQKSFPKNFTKFTEKYLR